MFRHVLISDPLVTRIPIRESGERLRDARDEPQLLFSRKREAENSDFALVRSYVLTALLTAQQHLPRGFRLVLEEGFRPLHVQAKIFEAYLSYLSVEYPTSSAAQLEREATKYVARPEGAPPHSTGGAVDVALASTSGEILDMGSDSDDTPYANGDMNYISSRSVSPRVRALREVFQTAMSSAEFVNYPPEWWHWSIGDQYWAYRKRRARAQYGSIELSLTRSCYSFRQDEDEGNSSHTRAPTPGRHRAERTAQPARAGTWRRTANTPGHR